ncbi:MAG: hypothetical protein DRG50_09315, partial [Deltaproteobacteria bacterium]
MAANWAKGRGKPASPRSNPRRKPTAKKRSTPSRKEKRPTKISVWLVVLLCIGVGLAITLHYFLQRPLPTPFPQRVRMLDQMLLAQFYQLEVPHNDIHKWEKAREIRGKSWTFSHWEVILPQGVGAQKVISQLRQRIRETSPDVRLTSARRPNGSWKISLRIDGLLTHNLILHPPKLKPPRPKLLRPRIAIVIDDLGLSKRAAEELLHLQAPLTFSIF